MCVYGSGGLYVHGEREDEGVECACMGRGREKGWRVHAWGEGGCVYMEGVGYACSERERMCIREGLIVCICSVVLVN